MSPPAINMSFPRPKPFIPKLCSNSCNSYSTWNSWGLCSNCYRKFLQKYRMNLVKKAKAQKLGMELEAATKKMEQELKHKEEAEAEIP